MKTSFNLSIIYDSMLERSQEVPDDDRSLTAQIARDLTAKIVSGASAAG